MKRVKMTLCGVLLLVVLVSPNLIVGCGPSFDEAAFSLTTRPDPPLENFLSGKLGVIQPTYRFRFLFAAYRQLAGVPLDKDEQAAIAALDAFIVPSVPPIAAKTAVVPPVTLWTQARAKIVPGDAPEIDPTVTREYATWTNCQDDAFRTAVRTLDDRIGRFGAKDANVREWVSGQDAVFANCGQQAIADLLPQNVDAKAPAWLRADRAYQIAAAMFYAGRYGEAERAFTAIASDKNSPWSPIAPYLAARCLVRQAVKEVFDREGEKLDKATLAKAESALKAIVADPAQRAIQSPAEGLLGFVEFRLHPEERAKELAVALAKPRGGPRFRQDLMDYTMLLDTTTPDDDMSDWIRTVAREGQSHQNPPPVMPSGKSAAPGDAHAIEKWRATKSLPWLVAAAMIEPAGSPAAAELRAEALKVPATSPAFLTLQYHAARLASQQADARTQIEALKNVAMTPSAANLFQIQRARLAPTFAVFLKEIQMKPVGTIEGDGGVEVADIPTEDGGIYFETYGAEALNKRVSLVRMGEAIKETALAPPLRRRLALAAWTRAVLLDDSATADALSTIVSQAEPSLASDMHAYQAASGAAKQFEAIWILLHHPGMRPYVTPGLSTRPEKPEERDMLRDNWWCGDVGAHAATEVHANPSDCAPTFDCPDADPDPNFPFPAWASEPERSAAGREWESLRKVGPAPNYLGEQTMMWAKAHANDPRVPEALAQVVTATHYGCVDKKTTAVSKAAFTLLHQRYPESEWAKKTRYWY